MWCCGNSNAPKPAGGRFCPGRFFPFRQAVCLVLVLLLLSGCSPQPVQLQLYAMDTMMDLKIWGAPDAAPEIEQEIHRLEQQLSVTRADSLVSQLNDQQTVTLPPDIRELLAFTASLCEKTGGAVNPCLYPVTKLWGFTTGSYQVPTEEEISQALSAVSIGNLHLQGEQAFLTHGAQLDLGAYAKGYAGQRAVSILQSHGASGALLSLGGSVQTYGSKPDGSPWRIGIQDPFGGDMVGTLALSGTWAVVTSGGYQRYFESEGVRYCHILDPATGRPVSGDLASVTIVAQSALLADGLSTALFVMGLEQACAYWRADPSFQAVLITQSGDIWVTSGLESSFSGSEFEVIAP